MSDEERLDKIVDYLWQLQEGIRAHVKRSLRFKINDDRSITVIIPAMKIECERGAK